MMTDPPSLENDDSKRGVFLMYKTAVITDEVSQDLVTAAKLAQRFNLDALEIRSVNERNPFQMNKQDFIDIKNIADDFGLSICAISSPLFKCDINDEKTIAEHYEGLKRCIEAAHLWGCNIIRGFTFWNDGQGADSFEKIAQYYKKPLEYAKEGNIIIAIESEPSVCTYNSSILVDFLQLVDSPNLAAIWDPGNEIADHKAPPPYPDGYKRLKPYICHVHLKDMKKGREGFEPALLGEGEVDYHGVLNALKRDDYAGYVSVETHYRIKSQLDEESILKPQGSGFSEGGLEATEVYLTILRDKYKWMEK
jgi:sugar phosphate isomerase/epimerase